MARESYLTRPWGAAIMTLARAAGRLPLSQCRHTRDTAPLNARLAKVITAIPTLCTLQAAPDDRAIGTLPCGYAGSRRAFRVEPASERAFSQLVDRDHRVEHRHVDAGCRRRLVDDLT